MWKLKNRKIGKIPTIRFWTSIKVKKNYQKPYNIIIYFLSIKSKKTYWSNLQQNLSIIENIQSLTLINTSTLFKNNRKQKYLIIINP